MTSVATYIDPALALDALSDHPAHATLSRHLHPSMALNVLVIPDAADQRALEIATLVCIVAGKSLTIVSDSVFALAMRLAHAHNVARSVGRNAHNAPCPMGVSLRFTEVGR